MVVYWDVAALWDFLLDYLLLLGAARLAGRSVRRVRIAAAAAAGAAYTVVSFALSPPVWTLLPAMLAMCALAFAGTGRAIKLTLLFALLACSLGGGALLLGRVFGDVRRFARCLMLARLPWGVFFAATALSYLLVTFVFRGAARENGAACVRVRVEYGGKSVETVLFRDTGNHLTDPLTGEGVPVIERRALAPLLREAPPFVTLRARTVGDSDAALDAFRCEHLLLEGRDLGARLVALSEEPFSGRYQGLWFGGAEEAKEYELASALG
ncbi:MAG: sigma-E processing peptidase SpoIIGA [Oscillospiraceae bacterium]|nr:sigma-E processing peptidase SpoIIGA [Oscillospiraceae bacterium]